MVSYDKMVGVSGLEPHDARVRDSIGYIESVPRGRFVGHRLPTVSAFTEVLDTLYTSIGERTRYTLYGSFTAPPAAFLHGDDPALRPRLRPAPVDELIEQMTPGHVFLSKIPMSEMNQTAPLRIDFSLKGRCVFRTPNRTRRGWRCFRKAIPQVRTGFCRSGS